MSVLGLAFQSAKVVKQNITIVLTYSAHVFHSAIVIFRFATKCIQVNVIISERKGCKNLPIAFFIVIIIYNSLFNKYIVKIIITVFLCSIRGMS